MEQNKASNESTHQAYKGTSPSWAAFSAATAYSVVAFPFVGVASGLTRLGFDRVFEKIPFKQDTWKRFKSAGKITAFMTGFFAIKEGMSAYAEAKDAKHQFNKLSIEHDLYREQLTEAGIKPKDLTFVREVDARTLKIEDKTSAQAAPSLPASTVTDAMVVGKVASEAQLEK